ncbi:DUF1152 domain-containing protein [Frankia sp. CNm7]|uniref:DUF1152 domain-containing protein n=1 Tax=Frankia nepalensis TaxID=1836974 RepID=A0A937RC88_9ACTN|nr:DUF1152 domain-containing protein [Frankia nepalensis]MBL7496328.1 DUF1152 domain-containing protein [Frankia nepalensis]MBL7508475.1 DUF1152 domain-containing protein [Frankia nepalensis]MBL7521639.1 DUF1152 domain-containing protein [Frankia nepalensis]MBL7627607.1 DUF1152 domain-containing protein [Frankia nepalensis]
MATGGGGDALGAVMIGRADQSDVDVAILTYAWERLRVDPLPGPRRAGDFNGLRPFGDLNARIVSSTAVSPPSRSTLPRLAGSIDTPLLLLDPSQGAVGIHDQLSEIIKREDVDKVSLIDVGGDAVARGDEPELLSPLADTLAIAACASLDVPTELVVAGPGLDGELAASAVLNRLRGLGGRRTSSVGHQDADAVRTILAWHPTEATALLAAAARGHRGTVELRGEGATVELNDASADVYVADLRQVYEGSLLAPLLTDTRSLAEAEDAVRGARGTSEIDYERRKLKTLPPGDEQPSPADLTARALAYVEDAGQRGIDLLTCRRIAEAIKAPRIEAPELRELLTSIQPGHDAFPLWSTRQRKAQYADSSAWMHR